MLDRHAMLASAVASFGQFAADNPGDTLHALAIDATMLCALPQSQIAASI